MFKYGVEKLCSILYNVFNYARKDAKLLIVDFYGIFYSVEYESSISFFALPTVHPNCIFEAPIFTKLVIYYFTIPRKYLWTLKMLQATNV